MDKNISIKYDNVTYNLLQCLEILVENYRGKYYKYLTLTVFLNRTSVEYIRNLKNTNPRLWIKIDYLMKNTDIVKKTEIKKIRHHLGGGDYYYNDEIFRTIIIKTMKISKSFEIHTNKNNNRLYRKYLILNRDSKLYHKIKDIEQEENCKILEQHHLKQKAVLNVVVDTDYENFDIHIVRNTSTLEGVSVYLRDKKWR